MQLIELLFVSNKLFFDIADKQSTVVVKQLVTIIYFSITGILLCLQCFDAVGWAAGRASGL